MKVQSANFSRPGQRGQISRKSRESGSAVFVFIALLAIMMILVTANSDALFHLRREINLLEQQQVKRLNAAQTNATDRVELPAKTESK